MKRRVSFLLAVILFLSGCGQTQQETEKKQYTATFLTLFDTVTTIVGKAENEESFQQEAQAVHDQLQEYHQLFDIYQEYEGIANLKTINDKAGIEPVKVDSRIISLLQDCRKIYEVTEGKVNVAMGSVLALWHEARDYGRNNPKEAKLPGKEELDEAAQHVDFEKIRAAEPKWYTGYSDNTNFTFLLTTLCDVASLYGPCAAAYGMEPWHPALQDAFDIMTGKTGSVSGYDGWEKESLKDAEHPLVPYNITEKRVLKVYDPTTEELTENGSVNISGRLIGGCLDCLDILVGTKFDKVKEFAEKYKEEGILWFLEACDLNVMSIRRALWQLEHSGWFKYTKGFLIGRPLCMGQELMGLDQYSAVTGVLSKYNVPIIMDADVGHFAPMMPLVCGSLATIKVDGNEIQIEMK